MEEKTAILIASDGTEARIDADLFPALSALPWCANRIKGRPYFQTNVMGASGRTTRQLHLFILPPKGGFMVDHMSRDTTDNRRKNLRYATDEQQAWNRTKQRGVLSSQYLGVSWKSRNCRWTAQIAYFGRKIYLGLFQEERHAAQMYNAAARWLFGEFANLNKI